MKDTELIKELLPYVYLACDQTVQCGVCGAVWWDCEEDLDENWHGDGCWAHEAMVACGMSKDIRRTQESRPSIKPCLAFVDAFLGSLQSRMFSQNPPEGMSKETWNSSVLHMLNSLRETPVDVSKYEHNVGVLNPIDTL